IGSYGRDHHERWDGAGYPNGLQRTDIPLYARIFFVLPGTLLGARPELALDALEGLHLAAGPPANATSSSPRLRNPRASTAFAWSSTDGATRASPGSIKDIPVIADTVVRLTLRWR
ncbi:MAG: HD domain-containing phosphohydrolase, partial [Actinomycetota bacterium]